MHHRSGCKCGEQGVVPQGDIGDQFYIIKEGEAVVTQKAPEGDKRINMLFKADFFGERALLTEEPRFHL